MAEAEARQGIRGGPLLVEIQHETLGLVGRSVGSRVGSWFRSRVGRGGRSGGGRGGGLIPLEVIALAAIPLTAVALAASRLEAVVGVGAASSETSDNQRYIGPAGVCELLFVMGSWRRHDLFALF